jgi:hypothetical protein
MPQKTLKYLAVLAYGVLALAGLSAAAADQKDKDKPALSGVWVKKAGELTLDFAAKDVLKISPHGEDKGFIVTCKYSIEKDGLVKAKISEFEGKAEVKEKAQEVIPLGTEFSFKWKVQDGIATLADLKGDKGEILKSHLEGDYEQKK